MEKLSKDFLIDIKSPFSFKRYDYDYFLPENLLTIENLLEKFNLFSSTKITISEEEKKDILKNFILSGLWGSSKKVILDKKAKFLGFKGRLYFYYKGNNETLKNKLHHLFIFSNFCGIGRKNTMGMGKVIYNYD